VHAADELKVEFDLAVPLSSPQGVSMQQCCTSCVLAGQLFRHLLLAGLCRCL
jgi:hypothetical protein